MDSVAEWIGDSLDLFFSFYQRLNMIPFGSYWQNCFYQLALPVVLAIPKTDAIKPLAQLTSPSSSAESLRDTEPSRIIFGGNNRAQDESGDQSADVSSNAYAGQKGDRQPDGKTDP